MDTLFWVSKRTQKLIPLISLCLVYFKCIFLVKITLVKIRNVSWEKSHLDIVLCLFPDKKQGLWAVNSDPSQTTKMFRPPWIRINQDQGRSSCSAHCWFSRILGMYVSNIWYKIQSCIEVIFILLRFLNLDYLVFWPLSRPAIILCTLCIVFHKF